LKDDPATQLADIVRQLALLAEAAKALSQTPLVEVADYKLPVDRDKQDGQTLARASSVN
jgi:hypothetical protein